MGKEVNLKSPISAIKNKMCYITEDRQYTGLFLIHTVARNTIIANMAKTKKFLVNPNNEIKTGNAFIERLGTKAQDSRMPVSYTHLDVYKRQP